VAAWKPGVWGGAAADSMAVGRGIVWQLLRETITALLVTNICELGSVTNFTEMESL
jgi:hypothetical protein